ncbi:MAG TPA: hypothetical protein VKV15_13240, partial [Bryobacteraceae bacterium]|nr:hypothetical protein [Bryobacteraceae bacterium]
GIEKRALEWLDGRPGTSSAWLRAMLIERDSDAVKADEAYARAVDDSGREFPDVLLKRARACHNAVAIPPARLRRSDWLSSAIQITALRPFGSIGRQARGP